MMTFEEDPGPPATPLTSTPATLPSSEFSIFTSRVLVSSSPLTSVTEYPRAFLSFRIPSAVTTTSVSALFDTSSDTCTATEGSPIVTSFDVNPTAEITRTSPCFASMAKIPSAFVETPFLVPFFETEAPASGLPSAETTLPPMVSAGSSFCPLRDEGDFPLRFPLYTRCAYTETEQNNCTPSRQPSILKWRLDLLIFLQRLIDKKIDTSSGKLWSPCPFPARRRNP